MYTLGMYRFGTSFGGGLVLTPQTVVCCIIGSMSKQELSFQLGFEMLSDEFEGDGLLHEYLPFSDLKGWVPEGGPYEDFLRHTSLRRLAGIRALSFLSYIGPEPQSQYFLEFSHDRFDHSLVVAMVIERILRNNYATPKEIITGIFAGLGHDLATPAHGDATMQIDPDNLSEEENWQNMLSENGGIEVFKKYGIDIDEMGKIIKNEGILGTVLDIADRVTYTMKDLQRVIITPHLSINPATYLSELQSLLEHYPDIGNIYKDVEINGSTQQVYFINPERLRAFLMLRAHLHEKLYLHPISQGRDLFVAKLLEPLYSPIEDPQKPLNPKNLRKMTDGELERMLSEWYQSKYSVLKSSQNPSSFFFAVVNWYPDYKQFETDDQAAEFINLLSLKPDMAIIGVKKRGTFDPATDYLVKDPKTGKIIPFRDYDHEGANGIEDISNSLSGIIVYYKDLSMPADSQGAQMINKLLKELSKKPGLTPF